MRVGGGRGREKEREREREVKKKRKKKEDQRKGEGEIKTKKIVITLEEINRHTVIVTVKHKVLCRERSERDEAHCTAGTFNSVPTQAQFQDFL